MYDLCRPGHSAEDSCKAGESRGIACNIGGFARDQVPSELMDNRFKNDSNNFMLRLKSNLDR